MPLISTRQINGTELASAIALASSGAAFSGNMLGYYSNSGYFGSNVCYTYSDQSITGNKRFYLSPIVPYSGDTGRAPSTLFVLDVRNALSGFDENTYVHRAGTETISGDKTFNQALTVNSPTATGHAVNLGYLTGYSGVVNSNAAAISGVLAAADAAIIVRLVATGGALSAFTVTGSSLIRSADISGLGGTLVIWSGAKLFISGAAGGGSSNTSVTGSSAIAAPNFTGVGSVVVSYNGTYVIVSGLASASSDTALSGYLETNFVHRGLITESISGLKTFTGAVGVGDPTTTGHAVNLGGLTGASGILSARDLTISGVLQAGINAASSTTNNYTFSGITGNFVNMSLFYDQYNLATGLNSVESFVARSFFFTGYAVGAINSGTQGLFSGSLYQRTPTNVKTNFLNFGLPAGNFFTGLGGFNQQITGMNRVGLDIYLIGTGLTGVSVGIFGVGY